jgi:tRNA(adenine34) deaminase
MDEEQVELLRQQDERYMRQALQMAERSFEQGEVPVGAIVVNPEGRVIGKGYNQMESLRDATAHAEILAIGAASQSLENWRLDGCTLYATLEPCPMCAGAILNSRIARVVYASPDHRLGACGSTMQVLEDNPLQRFVQVEGGVGKEESLYLLQSFFQELRARKKEEKKMRQQS